MLANGQTASDEPRRQDVILYRNVRGRDAVTPSDGATQVPVSAQVQITNPAAHTADMRLLQTTADQPVPTRLQFSTSGQML